MRSVVVTGAAGFLGSHLAKAYLDAGCEVLGIDDFCSSSDTSQHLEELQAYDGFTLSRCDISDSTVLRAVEIWAHRHSAPLLILNFACPASPPQYQAMPVHTMLTCVAGTEHMLDAASRFGSVLVHASTSEVYGEPLESPQRESLRSHVNSYGPRSCYDVGKMAAEALCYDYLNQYDVDARLVRIHNTYGSNMDPYDGRVVSNFVRQALKGEKLTVYGEGQQTRSFCYVDDLVEGIVDVGALSANPNGPINLGNPHEFTIAELADLVLKHIYGDGVRPRFGPSDPNVLEHLPLPVDDPTRRCPDISRARELLGWEPKVQLQEGLKKTIDYFKQVIK